jgi:hypothetical protein
MPRLRMSGIIILLSLSAFLSFDRDVFNYLSRLSLHGTPVIKVSHWFLP